MHVAVDHGNAQVPAVLFVQHAGGHGDVVEHAVPFSSVAEGVVRPAGEVHGHAAFERRPCGGNRPADAAPRTLDHPFRPRKSDSPLFVAGEPSTHDAVDVVRIVRERELVEPRGRRLDEILPRDDAFLDNAFAKPRILRHRESVRRRQRQHEMVAVEGAHPDD